MASVLIAAPSVRAQGQTWEITTPAVSAQITGRVGVSIGLAPADIADATKEFACQWWSSDDNGATWRYEGGAIWRGGYTPWKGDGSFATGALNGERLRGRVLRIQITPTKAITASASLVTG